jgi:large subunit ribosomal protein L30
MTEKTLKLTYHRSMIGYKDDQGHTVRSLGFTRLHQTIEKPDTPAIRGMVHKVRHLVRVEGEGEIHGTTVHTERAKQTR